MKIGNWLNLRRVANLPPGMQSDSPAPAGVPTTEVGVISTPQSIVTFAGAPAAVTLMWKVIGVAIPSVASSKLFPVVIALVVGMLIHFASASANNGTGREKALAAVFAFINSFAIAAAAIGIDTAVHA